jgi:adenosylhomocysteine nucleosidase
MSEKKKIGLLVAVEMESVFARYGTPGKTEKHGGFEIFRYENERYDLFVINSGIGEIAAAAATGLLIDRYEVELVVNFGVVGGLTEEMALSKTCVVTRVVHYDFDLSGIDPVQPAQYPGYDDIYLPADEELVKRALQICPELKPVICASADKFVGNQADKERLHRLYDADICEMESAAVLLTCRRNEVPCLMIKAVSDGLTGGGEEFYEAVQQCAAICLEVTDQIIREI